MERQTTELDTFDRTLGALDGLPGVLATSQATIQMTSPLVGNAETFIVQTVRQPDTGDTIFLQAISAGRSFRLVIPPRVAATIARQRDALTGRARVRGARQAVQTKREAGQVLGNPEALQAARKARTAGKRSRR